MVKVVEVCILYVVSGGECIDRGHEYIMRGDGRMEILETIVSERGAQKIRN